MARWRQTVAYLEERRYWQEFSMERSLTHLRARGTEIADKALDALLDALVAEDPEGRPLHGVRIAAAKEVFASPIVRSLFQERITSESGGQTTNVVTVIFKEGAVAAVEEVEDGHWTVRDDDPSEAGTDRGSRAELGTGDGVGTVDDDS